MTHKVLGTLIASAFLMMAGGPAHANLMFNISFYDDAQALFAEGILGVPDVVQDDNFFCDEGAEEGSCEDVTLSIEEVDGNGGIEPVALPVFSVHNNVALSVFSVNNLTLPVFRVNNVALPVLSVNNSVGTFAVSRADVVLNVNGGLEGSISFMNAAYPGTAVADFDTTGTAVTIGKCYAPDLSSAALVRSMSFCDTTYSITVARVPEPATFGLFGFGLASLGWSRRKKA